MVKIATVSGYKPHELGIFKQNDPSVTYIKMAIRKQLEALLDEGLQWVLISGQLGVEQWAAEAVFDLQQEGFDYLQLAVLTPFLNQEERWNEEKKELYESILLQADFVDAITKRPYENPSQFRLKNQFLIMKSDVLVLLYDRELEGSPKYLYEQAVQYQDNHPYDIRIIDFLALQDLVEEEQMKRMDF